MDRLTDSKGDAAICNSGIAGAMTVREVADALGVQEQLVRKHTRELYPYLMQNGVATYLNEEQVTAVKQKMRPVTLVTGAITDLEAMGMLARAGEHFKARYEQEQRARIEAESTAAMLESKVEADRPKVELYDRCMESGSLMSISTMAKKLEQPGLGPRNIFDFLARNGVLFRNSSGFWVPYQKHIDLGRFEVKQVVQPSLYSDGVRTRVYDATRVTQKGFAFVERLVSAAFPLGAKESA